MTTGVRVIHADDKIGALDVYINDRLCTRALPFAAITQYVQLPDGDNWVEVFQVGDQPKALYRQLISARSRRCYTACLHANKVFLIEDGFVKFDHCTHLRFIHLLESGPNVDLVDHSGRCFFVNYGYRGVSPYRAVTPQTTNFLLRVSGTRQILYQSPVYTLDSQQVFSIFVLGNAHVSSSKVLMVRDQERNDRQSEA
jgi:hypothetical protein